MKDEDLIKFNLTANSVSEIKKTKQAEKNYQLKQLTVVQSVVICGLKWILHSWASIVVATIVGYDNVVVVVVVVGATNVHDKDDWHRGHVEIIGLEVVSIDEETKCLLALVDNDRDRFLG